jgi:DNA-binding CsgD family transcriptional regulator
VPSIGGSPTIDKPPACGRFVHRSVATVPLRTPGLYPVHMGRATDHATTLKERPLPRDPRAARRSHESLLRSARQLERRLREVQEQLEALTAEAAAAPDTFDASASRPRPRLTAAEHRVLTLLPSDLSRGQIAVKLYLSPNTVKTHVQRIYRSFGVSTREDAIAAAREHGYL